MTWDKVAVLVLGAYIVCALLVIYSMAGKKPC